jgi:hypothetical protein
MRTTLSVDDDLAIQLQRIQAQTGRTWKQVVNDVLRAGLRAHQHDQQRPREVQRTQGVRLGKPRLGDISNVHEVLSLAEGDARR